MPKNHSRPVRIVFSILRIYLCVILLAYFLQDYMVYHPTGDIIMTPADISLQYSEFNIVPDKLRPDEKINGWYIPANKNKGTILFLHGNARNISYRCDSIKLINDAGYNCLVFDYRGYGKSGGEASEENIYRDSLCAWTYLTETLKTKPETIIIHGRSLGGGAASWLAGKTNPAGLVLESTFTSMPDIAQDKIFFAPVKFFCRNKFDTINRLDKFSFPVLFVHSKDDNLIDYSHGQKLFARYNGPKKMIAISGDHNTGFISSGLNYYLPLKKFYDSVLDNKTTTSNHSSTTGIVQ